MMAFYRLHIRTVQSFDMIAIHECSFTSVSVVQTVHRKQQRVCVRCRCRTRDMHYCMCAVVTDTCKLRTRSARCFAKNWDSLLIYTVQHTSMLSRCCSLLGASRQCAVQPTVYETMQNSVTGLDVHSSLVTRHRRTLESHPVPDTYTNSQLRQHTNSSTE
jgi:hypothetical protein